MTAQFSDRLQFEGRSFALDTEPLYCWLERKKNRRIRFRPTCTAHRRGYWATWAVHRGRLYLTHFSARLANGRFAGFKTLFENYTEQFYLERGVNDPENLGPGRFAFWFTGWLRCHFGSLLRYQHSPYGTTYEGELLLRFEDGFLTGQRIVHRRRDSPAGRTNLEGVFSTEDLDELFLDLGEA